MKRAGASSQTPTHFASAFLPTTSPSPSARPSSALAFSHDEHAAEDEDDTPHPNHVDRLDSLPLFNTRAMNSAAAQAAAVADSSSSSQLGGGGGLDGAAPRRRGVAGGLPAARDGGGGFDQAGLDLDGDLDGDEKRGLTGNGRAPARREKPAYKPPAKTWVSDLASGGISSRSTTAVPLKQSAETGSD